MGWWDNRFSEIYSDSDIRANLRILQGAKRGRWGGGIIDFQTAKTNLSEVPTTYGDTEVT